MIKNQKLNIQNWNNIPWSQVINKVQDLKNKIVKANLNNNMRLVYKLQNQLVSSFEGRALAIRRIITNSGAKTPGIDNILWNTPGKKFKAIA